MNYVWGEWSTREMLNMNYDGYKGEIKEVGRVIHLFILIYERNPICQTTVLDAWDIIVNTISIFLALKEFAAL